MEILRIKLNIIQTVQDSPEQPEFEEFLPPLYETSLPCLKYLLDCLEYKSVLIEKSCLHVGHFKKLRGTGHQVTDVYPITGSIPMFFPK